MFISQSFLAAFSISYFSFFYNIFGVRRSSSTLESILFMNLGLGHAELSKLSSGRYKEQRVSPPLNC